MNLPGLWLLLALGACDEHAASPPQTGPEARPRRPNIALVILDDVGVDKVGVYGEGPEGVRAPCTPNLDALAAQGLLFRHAWADPVCSPTRAQLLTGRHGFRTGIGTIIDFKGGELGLDLAVETTLPRILAGYDSSAVGKWHVASMSDGPDHPIAAGFGYFAGTLFNIASPAIPCGPDCTPPDCREGGPLGYFNWVKLRAARGSPPRQECVTRYATIDTTDEALARAAAMKAPWFLHVGYNAAHTPTEMPPPELLSTDEACQEVDDGSPNKAWRIVDAMMRALDHEVGRLVAGLRRVDPDVILVVLGDNGTSIVGARGRNQGCFSPRRSKGSVYEGGLRVPLIVAGPGVAHGECQALVASTDLFATIAELAGASSAAEDSISLAPYLAGHAEPLRTTVYAETFLPNAGSRRQPGAAPFAPRVHARAVRGERYKLIRTLDDQGTHEELYDLVQDPCEQDDLLQRDETELDEGARAGLGALRDELRRLGVYP